MKTTIESGNLWQFKSTILMVEVNLDVLIERIKWWNCRQGILKNISFNLFAVFYETHTFPLGRVHVMLSS